jgi:NADH dehydrogenase
MVTASRLVPNGSNAAPSSGLPESWPRLRASGSETDRAGRIKVAADLSVPRHPNIFVIGDTAQVLGSDGQLLPGVAPVAKQQGRYVAELLIARTRGRSTGPFRYRDYGSLATLGRKSAVAQIGRLRLTGFVAWVLWSVAHIYFLIGFRNRLLVATNWAWNYVTFQRGTRLITGLSGSRIEEVASGGSAGETVRDRKIV